MNAAVVAFLALVPLAAPESKSPVGSVVAPFELPDYLGTTRKLEEYQDRKATVLVFIGVECPVARQYGERLAQLAAKYEPQGVAFLAIDSNQQDSLAEIAHYARESKIEFPILKDAGNVVADQLGAQRTPEALVLDGERKVRYWGRIDDQHGVGYSRPRPLVHDLASALDELLAGKEISRPSQPPVGCFIGRVSKTPAQGEITYTKHVARVLHQHCVRCHRPGEVAPFALDQYADVTAWSQTIREVIEEGRMPPWHANPAHGRFFNDARLPDAEKKTLLDWIANGCPPGEAADMPNLPAFPEGWQIPKPDVVYQMPQPFAVPARGTVEYQYFTIDPGFKEDRWIKAAECRPGNRAVTHHLILFYHPPGKEEFEPIEPLFNSIVGFAPGLPPAVYPHGTYRRIPAGSKLIIQAHYTPNGTAQSDQSEFGLIFADEKEVQREFIVGAAYNIQFLIPPGAKNHAVASQQKFEQDTLLYALTPHMHLRGKSFRFTAHFPDGREQVLLDVPRYDFNWQNSYGLAEPLLLPAGSEIRCAARYDNSAENLANPNPSLPVLWGDQTWQEMMVGTWGIASAEQDFSLGLPKSKPLDDGNYEVTFRYRPLAKAQAVYLAGTFNGWNPTALAMNGPDADGFYWVSQTLAAGTYEYKYVLDGKNWRADPANPTQIGDYRNSQLRIGRK
jgi:peroxiredoxin/mono/diheme cytochrome c family protein